MRVYVGQTRSKALIAELSRKGIGECTARGEFPPRRTPWFYDNGAFGDWKAGRPFDRAAFEADMAEIARGDMKPDFIVVPDIVAGGEPSLVESLSWLERLSGLAPRYLAIQDGMGGGRRVRGARALRGRLRGRHPSLEDGDRPRVVRARPLAREALSHRSRRQPAASFLGLRVRGRLRGLELPPLVAKTPGVVSSPGYLSRRRTAGIRGASSDRGGSVTWTITKHATFDAAHFLPHHLGKCRRMHGHTYRVTVGIEASILVSKGDQAGMVCDYDVLGSALKGVCEALDHRLLNEIAGLENPTTEVLARWIAERIEGDLEAWGLVFVRVEESSTTACEYRP